MLASSARRGRLIEVGIGFVQNQYAGSAQQRPCQGQTNPLALREIGAIFRNPSIQPPGQTIDQPTKFTGLQHLLQAVSLLSVRHRSRDFFAGCPESMAHLR